MEKIKIYVNDEKIIEVEMEHHLLELEQGHDIFLESKMQKGVRINKNQRLTFRAFKGIKAYSELIDYDEVTNEFKRGRKIEEI